MNIYKIIIDTIIAASALGLLGFTFSLLLYIAFSKLAVKTDPKLELIMFALPGSNCGACGFAGCQGLAEHLIANKVEITGCMAGGSAVAQKLAEVMGVTLEAKQDMVAFVACRGGHNEAKAKYVYRGIDNCQGAHLLFGGEKTCQYGCLGLGSCVEACPFDAISITENGVAYIHPDKCKGCQKCVAACPRKVIVMQPKNQNFLVACKNLDKPKIAREVCSISCIGCKICEKKCPENAIIVENNLAVINIEKCNQCGICEEKCPRETIRAVSSLKV